MSENGVDGRASESGAPIRPVRVVHSVRTNEKCSPPSTLRNRPCGSLPAHTTPGSLSDGASCHTRPKETSVSTGKAIEPSSGSAHVTPRSSLWNTDGPQCSLVAEASKRGERPRTSMATAYTPFMKNCGSDNVQLIRSLLRPRISPFVVPIASRKSVMIVSLAPRADNDQTF